MSARRQPTHQSHQSNIGPLSNQCTDLICSLGNCSILSIVSIASIAPIASITPLTPYRKASPAPHSKTPKVSPLCNRAVGAKRLPPDTPPADAPRRACPSNRTRALEFIRKLCSFFHDTKKTTSFKKRKSKTPLKTLKPCHYLSFWHFATSFPKRAITQ